MATVITWSVTAMDCRPAEGDLADVVYNVHWTCAGVDGEFNGSVYSTCVVPGPGDPFTPYADLTQDQVLGWIWANGVDKASAESAVEAQIEGQKHPTSVTPPLPWV
jgi:hypothetical protein